MREWMFPRLLAVVLIIATSACDANQGADVQEIKFDVGRNIVETAEASGVPRYATGEAFTRLSYDIPHIPENLPFRYQRLGYVIIINSPYAFTMYTDEKLYPNLEVFDATLLISRHAVDTHEKAYAYVMDLLDQFERGKWKRYFQDDAARINGRSSYLNEAGDIDTWATGSLDPSYRPPMEEWMMMTSEGTIGWEWIGDGVRAELSVSSSVSEAMGIWYRVKVDFQLHDRKLINEEGLLARDLESGDAKGFNSTEKYKLEVAERQAHYRILEANAIKRGDSVVPSDID